MLKKYSILLGIIFSILLLLVAVQYHWEFSLVIKAPILINEKITILVTL